MEMHEEAPSCWGYTLQKKKKAFSGREAQTEVTVGGWGGREGGKEEGKRMCKEMQGDNSYNNTDQ